MDEPPVDEPRKPRWSDPDDKRLEWVYLVGCLGVLGLIFVNIPQFKPATLFGGAALFAFCAGIFFTRIFNE